MPGIVGLISAMPREQAEQQLRQMLATMCHESFYVSGTWCDAELGLYVGWVAHRDSFSEKMPLRDGRTGTTLIFSGEEFSEAAPVATPTDRVGPNESRSPNYLINLRGIEKDFPKSLNGRFHGILADPNAGALTLFNDRYGMQRIYYHEAADAFYFAAEAKAILRVRPELRDLDQKGLGEFIACGCVLENRTLFSGISILPPGSAWIFRNATVTKKTLYFDPKEWEEQEILSEDAYYEELRATFSKIIGRYFSGDEKLAMSLTGGLDTRMILAWHRSPQGKLPCYSFGSMYRDTQDVIVARQVAKSCGQTHQVIPVGSEFLSQFSKYAERTVYLTDGSLSVNHSPDLYVNEKARQIAPIRLTGNYGGEVLRRVRAFKPVQPAPGLLTQEIQRHVGNAAETFRAQCETHPLSFAVFRQAPWHHYGLLALEQTQLTLRSPYLDNEFVKTVFQAPDSATRSNDLCLRLIGDGDPELLKIRTDRGYGGTKAGLKAKLTTQFHEFTAKAEYGYDYGMPQWAARIDSLISPLQTERVFLGRHKFYHFRIWYRDVLKDFLKEMLLDHRSQSRPYLERDGLKHIVEGHVTGRGNFTTSIHKALSLELIHRHFIDGQ